MTSRRSVNQLLDATARQAAEAAVTASAVLRIGKVTAVQPASKTVTVLLDSTTLRGVPYMRSYTPAVDDVVWLLHQNSTIVAIGAF